MSAGRLRMIDGSVHRRKCIVAVFEQLSFKVREFDIKTPRCIRKSQFHKVKNVSLDCEGSTIVVFDLGCRVSECFF